MAIYTCTYKAHIDHNCKYERWARCHSVKFMITTKELSTLKLNYSIGIF